MRYIFAGDRDISIRVLQFLIEKVGAPEALWVTPAGNASHAESLKALVPRLAKENIFEGNSIRHGMALSQFREMNLDYIFCIHFPFIIPAEIIALPKVGVLNLHPAYLPFNKGWHTPSWAILEDTPFGATLHFMNAKLDDGDILHRKMIDIQPSATAHSIYQEVKQTEWEVFQEAWPSLAQMNPPRLSQDQKGTMHKKDDLKTMQVLDINNQHVEETIRKMRALTTNNWHEACYFIKDNKKYFIQIEIRPEGEL
jgi:methionyl-tRNA formyltransferase